MCNLHANVCMYQLERIKMHMKTSFEGVLVAPGIGGGGGRIPVVTIFEFQTQRVKDPWLSFVFLIRKGKTITETFTREVDSVPGGGAGGGGMSPLLL